MSSIAVAKQDVPAPRFWRAFRFAFHILFHPFDGFWDLKHERRGSLKVALSMVLLVVITTTLRRQLTGFLFNMNDPSRLSIGREIFSVALPFFLWCISNWAFTTLMDGDGSFLDIVMATGYALFPIVLLQLPLIPVSHFLTAQEGAFYFVLNSTSIAWMAGLVFFGMMVTHQYTLGKALLTAILTIVGMALIVFVVFLLANLVGQLAGFVIDVYREARFRV